MRQRQCHMLVEYRPADCKASTGSVKLYISEIGKISIPPKMLKLSPNIIDFINGINKETKFYLPV